MASSNTIPSEVVPSVIITACETHFDEIEGNTKEDEAEVQSREDPPEGTLGKYETLSMSKAEEERSEDLTDILRET